MKTYHVTAIIDTRRSKDWVLHGRQNRVGKFCASSPSAANQKAVKRWGKQLRGPENVVVVLVRPL